MRASRWILGLSTLLLTIIMLAGPAVAGAEGEEAGTLAALGLTGEEQFVLGLVNEARAAEGLPAVTVAHPLASLAGTRADDMATRGYFSHTTPEGETVLSMLPARGVNYQLAGEALQRNNHAHDRTATEAARALLASPAHRALLLDGRFSEVGVGHAVSGDMHYYAIVLVQPV